MFEIRDTNIYGKGVFANTHIPKGTKITFDCIKIKQGSVPDYEFGYTHIESLLCLGIGSYFNHSDTPNMKFPIFDEHNKTQTWETIKDIKEGEEMVFNYGCEFKSKLIHGEVVFVK